MRCPRCGSDQRTGAAFCNACGAPLPQQAPASASPPQGMDPSKKKMIAIAIACVLLAMVGLVFLMRHQKQSEIRGLEKQMSFHAANGDYDSALGIAERLYDMTGDDQYLSRSTELEQSARAAEDLAEAKKKAAEVPETKTIVVEKEKPVEKTIVVEKEKPASKQASSNGSKLSKVAANLKDKDITSTALKSNVRTEPTIHAPVLYAFEKGSVVHVYDTVIEGNIIWLDIGDGWTSHKNFNGDLKY